MEPKVLVIVLTYNGVALTLDCLASLREVGYPALDVAVVDNASTDSTPQIVRTHFPEVLVIETGANLGYAEGNNVGMRHALAHGYDYVLLLNNDTEVASQAVSVLVAACEAQPDIGVAGPKVLYYDRPDLLYSAGGRIDWGRGKTHMLGIDQPDAPPYDQPADVDFVNGCALLARSSAIAQAGLLDPRFGMYFEETEWCVRIARHGWRIHYTPTSRILHKVDPLKQDWSPRIAYYMTRNRLLFLRLTGAPLRAWIDAVLFQDLRTWVSWTVKPKWRHRGPQRAAMIDAWRDFMRGNLGMAAR